MFIVIYRWRIHPGREEEFRAAWEELSAQYIQLRGQRDAKLTHGDDDVWVGKAVWPDRDAYILALERGVTDARVANRMNAAVAEKLDPEFRYID
ncbi:MAG TPA: antibiotic biosynthesis monooxygenase [Gammaproteobacteria bacterium]